ncbi:MAG TPA: alpha/beta fold hydrolase [Pyrinomonadaceae bacterium]|nr:alpha/beta fold hydrolase [Pyrinomonadaceae bacterium]
MTNGLCKHREIANATRGLVLLLLLLWSGTAATSHVAQPLAGSVWTGGFWLDGRWVAVNVRFSAQDQNSGGTADVISPYYGGSENAINVPLENLKHTGDILHLEVPVQTRKVIFDGRRNGNTISGNFVYGESKGTFGLTPWANVTLATLEKYYGAYRVAPDHVISLFRGWNYARTLNYVDYKTGQVGTLWPSENEFFSGDGLAVSFPATTRVIFEMDSNSKPIGLTWRTNNGVQLKARRIELKEERITFQNGEVSLGGTLILPATGPRHSVVIVTPGDYGTVRDLLRMWAHNFASRGIAAFIFDARGGGESSGTANSSSFSDLANDVLAAVQSLKTRTDVNPKQIGLFGFSNSSFIVSLAASRSQDVSFLIMQSFVGVPGWKQESFRAETQLRVDKFPESTVKQGADFMRLKFEVARTGNGWSELQALMEKARGERWLAYTNPPNRLERLTQRQSIMTYDPVPALESLKIPVFAFWGDKDTFLPVQESVANFRRAMVKAGNKRYLIKVYTNASHSLLETKSGSPSTGGAEQKFVAGLWKLKADWVHRHTTLSK